jgi:hypothetical protein
MEQTSNESTEMPLTEVEEKIRIELLLKGKSCRRKTEENTEDDEIFENRIELKNELTNSMMKISLLLRSIPNYNLYFQPIVNIESIQYGKLTEDNIESCETIPTKTSNVKQTEELVTMKMRNYENTLIDHIRRQTTENKLKVYIEAWFQSIEILKKMKEKNIIHMNIHNQTMLYSEEKGRPILSRYNMAYDVKEYMDVDSDWEKNFPEVDEYGAWCIDIYLLSHMATKKEMEGIEWKSKGIDNETLHKWCQEYMSNLNAKINSNPNNSILKTETEEYLKTLQIHFEGYNGVETLFEYLMKNAYTWDVYSLCNLFLEIGIETNVINSKNISVGYIEKTVEVMRNFMYSMPNARASIEGLESSMTTIYSQLSQEEYVKGILS